MAIIETEIWKKNPDMPGTVIFDKHREAQDIFDELEKHLKADGRIPDEYFLFDDYTWGNRTPFPRDADIISNVSYGGSEGIYLDVFIRYKKEVPEFNNATGMVEKKPQMVTEHFATGKTLGEGLEDLDRMNLVAASVTAAFYGMRSEVLDRYAKLNNGTEKHAFPRTKESMTSSPRQVPAMTQAINGVLVPGDWVVAASRDEYAYLVGIVSGITTPWTPEQSVETANESNDVHVDFSSFIYPAERKKKSKPILTVYAAHPRCSMKYRSMTL